MIPFNTLRKLAISKNEFIEFCYKHNFERAYEKGRISPVFISSTRDLSSFCELINGSSWFKNDIYYQVVNDFVVEGSYYGKVLKFYLIDPSGFSYGFMFGPQFEFPIMPSSGMIETTIKESLAGRMYFGGPRHEGNSERFCDVVDSMGLVEGELTNTPSLDEIRMRYCPLMNPWSNERIRGIYYLTSNNQDDIREFGGIIYKSPEKSFILPLIPLISKALNCEESWEFKYVTIDTSTDRNFMQFKFVISGWNKKYSYDDIYRGKISYESFEVVEIHLHDRKSDYIG